MKFSALSLLIIESSWYWPVESLALLIFLSNHKELRGHRGSALKALNMDFDCTVDHFDGQGVRINQTPFPRFDKAEPKSLWSLCPLWFEKVKF